MPAFDISHATTSADLQDVARLFRAYAASLTIDLGYQGFNAEVSGLPGQYAPPRGLLLLARDGKGAALGCVGVRPRGSAEGCEMKRLFVAPGARGTGLGRALAEAAIEQARGLGYDEMRLDTLVTMQPALSLYEQLGFRPCAPYYAPTPDGTTFRLLQLASGAHAHSTRAE